jgi:carbonic anhydrase
MRRARELPEDRQLELLTQMNVIVQLEHLKTHPSVKRRLKQRKLALRGWVYRIDDGEILQLQHRSGEFLPWP